MGVVDSDANEHCDGQGPDESPNQHLPPQVEFGHQFL